jgi:hypothetical protein
LERTTNGWSRSTHLGQCRSASSIRSGRAGLRRLVARLG